MESRCEKSWTSEDEMKAIAKVQDCICSYTDSMLIRCAVQLGIPDAVRRRADSATLSDLAADLSADPARLHRILRILLRMGLLTTSSQPPTAAREERYGLTRSGELLLTTGPDGSENLTSSAHIVMAITDPGVLRSWINMAASIFGPAPPFEVENGCGFFEDMTRRPEWGEAFNRGMEAEARVAMPSVIEALGGQGALGEAGRVRTLVDVGGGTGALAASVAEAFPHVRCSVLELPHIVEENRGRAGVELIAGDMFKHVPSADAVLLKSVLHDWGDEKCLTILKRCKEAIPKEGGVVIIVDLITDEQNEDGDMFSKWKWHLDVQMMVLFGGKERTRKEWDLLLHRAGFRIRRVAPSLRGYTVIEVISI